MERPRRAAIACAPLLAVAWPAAAEAHPMAGVGDFYAGMLHPLTTVEHVLPLAALGLLAGQQPRGTTLRVIPAVPAALIAGAALALALPAPPDLQAVTIGSMVALGALVALAASLPPVLADSGRGAAGGGHRLGQCRGARRDRWRQPVSCPELPWQACWWLSMAPAAYAACARPGCGWRSGCSEAGLRRSA